MTYVAISGDNEERDVERTVKYADRNIIAKQCVNLCDEENKPTRLTQTNTITSNALTNG